MGDYGAWQMPRCVVAALLVVQKMRFFANYTTFDAFWQNIDKDVNTINLSKTIDKIDKYDIISKKRYNFK